MHGPVGKGRAPPRLFIFFAALCIPRFGERGNDLVAPIHPKMALKLQRPLANGILAIVAVGAKKDG